MRDVAKVVVFETGAVRWGMPETAVSVSEEEPAAQVPHYAAMVESIDRGLTDIMAALKKTGALDNTLILVLSDNGASAHADAAARRKHPNRTSTVRWRMFATGNSWVKDYSNVQGTT